MNETQLSDFYRPPLSLGPQKAADRVIECRFDKSKKLEVVNRTLSKNFFVQVLRPECELVCTGLFDEVITIDVHKVSIKGKRIKPKFLAISALQSYRIELQDEESDERLELAIDFHMPAFLPLQQMGVRIKVDGQVVFEQGKIPRGYFVFGKGEVCEPS